MKLNSDSTTISFPDSKISVSLDICVLLILGAHPGMFLQGNNCFFFKSIQF